MTPILITRPQPDADAFAEECRAAGFLPLIAPLMEVRFREDWRPPLTPGALAFTSANGVRAWAHGGGGSNIPAFCVGEATAAAAGAAGFTTLRTAGGELLSLAELISGAAAGLSGEIVHIAGARRAGDLIAMLKARAIVARRIVAYETREAVRLPETAEAPLSSGENLAVALFSPRTARLFLDLVEAAELSPALRACRALCLSPAVADIAGKAEWARIDVAAERHSAAMIDLLRNPA